MFWWYINLRTFKWQWKNADDNWSEISKEGEKSIKKLISGLPWTVEDN